MKKIPLAITAPELPDQLDCYTPTIFLAGSIDDGAAVDWQSKVIAKYDEAGVTFFNPRRKGWVAGAEEDSIRKQIAWEHAMLQRADAIIMNFIGASLSPISLLELGLYAKSGKIIVVCPKDFWRNINVEETCKAYDIPLFEKLSDGMDAAIYLAHERIGA